MSPPSPLAVMRRRASADEPAEALRHLTIDCEGGPVTTMYFVYILRSEKQASRIYVGVTNDLDRRLGEHANSERDQYTHRYRPWKLETYVVFSNRLLAMEFEKYLKTGSGRAFMRRHLVR
jgi:predicted GIY-YIG superfamily endonuclease